MVNASEAPVKNQNNTSSDSTFELLKENFEASNPKKDAAPATSAPIPNEDLTANFKEKFTALQSSGKIEDFQKLHTEVQESIKSGKKISSEFLSQIEISTETTEQRQIRELTAQKEGIQKDLKLSEVEKIESLKKLESVKEPNFWEKEDFNNTPGVDGDPAEKNKDKKENQTDFKALYEKATKDLEQYTGDDFIKSYKSATDSGKDTASFISEIASNNPATLTDEQIVEKGFTRMGLTEDEVIEQREHFKSSPLQRREFIAKEKNILKADYKKNFEKYSTNNAAETQRQIHIAEQGIKGVNDFVTNIQGKEVWGINYDSTQTQKLTDWANEIMAGGGLFKKDGTWDVPKIMRLGMKELNTQHMLQKAFEKGQFTSDEKKFQEYGRPSNNNGIAKVVDASIVNKDHSDLERQTAEWRKKNNLSEVTPAR